MTSSLLNALVAPDVAALLDRAVTGYAGDETFVPGMPREQAEAIIHAVLWASGCRSDSFANAYAHNALFHAMDMNGLIEWLVSYKDFEAKAEAARQAVQKAGETE